MNEATNRLNEKLTCSKKPAIGLSNSFSGAAKAERIPVFEKAEGCVKPFDEIGFRCYIRANAGKSELCDALAAYCDGTEVLSDEAGVVEVITGKLTKPETDKIREQFAGIESVIRVLD